MEKKEERLSFADWLIILVFGLASFLHFRGFGIGPAEERREAGSEAVEMRYVSSSMGLEQVDRRRLLLFILDFRDFSCMVCLESFLELYRRLPLQVKTQDCWGILIVPQDLEREDVAMGIAEKKLEGFIRAHQILFPVLMDRHKVFGAMAERGSGIILLDAERQAIIRFDFPLMRAELEEILKIFAE